MNNTPTAPKVVNAEFREQAQIPDHPFLETPLLNGEPWMSFYRQERRYLVRIVNLVDFEVSLSGTEINIHAVPGVSAHTIEHLYQNQALPLAYSLQQMLALHGSAIEIGDKAVAFLAVSRSGKSTLAASFASNGFRFLTDDGLLLEKPDEDYVIRPSHPSIRLWADSCKAMARKSSRPEPAIDYSTKARFLADEHFVFCDEPRPLAHVYFLGDGSSKDVSITPVSSQQAFIGMRRHCFLLGVDEHEILKNNFQQLADLSRQAIFFGLDYPRRYDILDQVREAVVNHSYLAHK